MPQNKEINLINKETKKTIRYQKLKNSSRNLAVILTAVVLLINALTIIFFFIIKKEINDNKIKVDSLKRSIAALDKNESYVFTITDRASKINSLLKERKLFLSSIAELESLLVSGFNLSGLNFGSSDELKILASCDDSQSLANFNERLELLSQQGLFSKVVYSSMSRSGTGKYDFSLELKK